MLAPNEVYRTIILFRAHARAVFVYGFAKNDRANLTVAEEATFRYAAKLVLALSNDQMTAEVMSGRLIEVTDDAQDLQK